MVGWEDYYTPVVVFFKKGPDKKKAQAWRRTPLCQGPSGGRRGGVTPRSGEGGEARSGDGGAGAGTASSSTSSALLLPSPGRARAGSPR